MTGPVAPVRAFWPLCPRPAVFPLPEPMPRPTRFACRHHARWALIVGKSMCRQRASRRRRHSMCRAEQHRADAAADMLLHELTHPAACALIVCQIVQSDEVLALRRRRV